MAENSLLEKVMGLQEKYDDLQMTCRGSWRIPK